MHTVLDTRFLLRPDEFELYFEMFSLLKTKVYWVLNRLSLKFQLKAQRNWEEFSFQEQWGTNHNWGYVEARFHDWNYPIYLFFSAHYYI